LKQLITQLAAKKSSTFTLHATDAQIIPGNPKL